MAKENKTVADTIAEMRSDANADEYTPDGILGQKLNYIADRLEAAHKRERGDAAKLREALKKCLLYIAIAESVGIGTITLNDKVKLYPKKIIKSAKEALAATKKEGGAK